MAVSIREVASRAGMSTATVSRVLNNLRDVSVTESTRARVLLAANELGYHPSAVARSLRSRKTDVLGIVLPPPLWEGNMARDAFFNALMDGAFQAAANNRMDTMVYTGHLTGDGLQDANRFRDGRCDGLLMFYQPPDSGLITAVLDADIPVVLVDDQRDDARLTCVDVDNTTSAYQMTEYLLGLGHRRIAILSSEGVATSYVALRVEGYHAALAANGIAIDEELACHDALPWAPQTVVACIDRLMDRPVGERPTALFCFGDDIGAVVLTALNWRGTRVPEDISVVGFNDDGRAAQLEPPLTTLRQPYRKIGACAVDLLIEQIADLSCRGKKVTLPTELIVRGSTGPSPSL